MKYFLRIEKRPLRKGVAMQDVVAFIDAIAGLVLASAPFVPVFIALINRSSKKKK